MRRCAHAVWRGWAAGCVLKSRRCAAACGARGGAPQRVRARTSARAPAPPAATTATRCHHMSYERQRGPRDVCVTARACARVVVAQCVHSSTQVAMSQACARSAPPTSITSHWRAPGPVPKPSAGARRARGALGPTSARRERHGRHRARAAIARGRDSRPRANIEPPRAAGTARRSRACVERARSARARARPSARRAGPR